MLQEAGVVAGLAGADCAVMGQPLVASEPASGLAVQVSALPLLLLLHHCLCM